ncbi:MAG: threonine--tRNA ligase [Candidatus Magasanikbacteria bacterium RIFOXYC2_FULL_42_28]|uniref:Threonine--tRNA ligase n=1 Tax=Candidatus Magasanikbacteria bacterium RIFOXYC2_FULL_42_28 TaxID=1798704 RepID=A0A1F6NU61_9BACT|nr:MAG: threonine--tRNA ligase [Candidatus Magasanikbacteria bacterium RIFOXYC2_FULL_42_28]
MDKEQLEHLRHSCAHLLAAAVLELYPNAKRTIGPAIENGFYYDFDFGVEKISETDLKKIEEKMRQIAPTWEKFERQEVSASGAKAVFKDNEYKIELIEEFSVDGQALTLYKSGAYVDLCRGGHSENPSKELKHFKLLSVAGAYWRGSEKNKMLTRIYGTCFPTKNELYEHLHQLEEAKKRDHRKIGAEQELFCFDDRVGKGQVLWLPNGTIIRNEVEKLTIEKESEGDYLRVRTPHLAKEELFLTSGHLPYYKDSMYPPMVMDDGNYYLKAMNCPHHHTIYNFKPHSYRELPLRLVEYGECFRNELSGTLAGLLRVRAMAMNDAHIYCRKEQIKDEFKSVMELVMEYFRIFKLENYWFRLSKWSPDHLDKYINEPENWQFSEGVIREVLQEMKVKFVEAADEAAFYGPKVDVMFKSVIGREETMSTIQLDFAAKKRFDLKYTDSDGKENNEVFVIHRAPLSTHERFMAFLIEHFAGVWPVWLSPVQVLFAPVASAHVEGAKKLAGEFKVAGIRVETDDADETVGNKVRKAVGRKIPYIVVVGDKELAGGELMVRVRGEEKPAKFVKEEFLAKVVGEIKART